MLIWLFVVEMVKKSRGDIVRNYNFIFELTWSVCNTVSCCNKQTVWSELGMSDVVTHFVVLVPRFVVRNLAGCKMGDSSFAGVRVLLSSFPSLTICEGDVYVE